jgi:hypothetical protein
MFTKNPLIYSSILAAGISLPTGSVHCGKILEARAQYQEVMKEYEVAKEDAWGIVVGLPHGSNERTQGSADWHACLFQDFAFHQKNDLEGRLKLLKGSMDIDTGSNRYTLPYDLPGPVYEAEYRHLTERTRETIRCWNTMK